MTFLEKRMEERPRVSEKEKPHNCIDCWNREIPEEKETYSLEEVKETLDISEKDVNKTVEQLDLGMVLDADINEKTILDSGERRQFETGAVRDIQEGKGRCDLMPLDVIAAYLNNSGLSDIALFQETGNVVYLYDCLASFNVYPDNSTMLLEVSKHFEEGAKKYGENNWQKGIPTKHYIDSAIRHYLKYLRGDQDEPHDRAFVWNILCCIWTCKNKPELNDYRKEEPDENTNFNT